MTETGIQASMQPWYRVMLVWLGRLVGAYFLVGLVFAVIMAFSVWPHAIKANLISIFPMWVIFWPIWVVAWCRGSGGGGD